MVEANEDRHSAADKEAASRGLDKIRGVVNRANISTTEVDGAEEVVALAGETMTSRNGIVTLRSTSAQIGS